MRKLLTDPRTLVFLALLGFFGVYMVLKFVKFSSTTTDNAIVRCDIVDVVSEISGVIEQINFQDNEFVEKGVVLIKIRDDVLRSSVSVLEAEYETAKTETELMRGELRLNETQLKYSRKDLARLAKLNATGSIPEKEFDDAEQRVMANRVNVDNARARLQTHMTRIDVAKAKLDEAKVLLNRTEISSLRDGIVTNRRVAMGEYMDSGQTIASITSCHEKMWVEANFKETQLGRMAVGQEVDIHIDTYPDEVFKGVVDSIASGSGSIFSVLPPENATGNFTKVVQRFPVKITIPDIDARLKIGMSAVVKVDLEPDEANSAATTAQLENSSVRDTAQN